MDDDCDDMEMIIWFGVFLFCDGLDNNCDGIVDFSELDFEWLGSFLDKNLVSINGYLGNKFWVDVSMLLMGFEVCGICSGGCLDYEICFYVYELDMENGIYI